MNRKYIILLAALLFFINNVFAQDDLQSQLEQFGQQYGMSYVGPMPELFGAANNMGLYQDAKIASGLGIDLYVGVSFMGAMPSDASKTFSGTFRFDITEDMLTGNPDADAIKAYLDANPDEAFIEGTIDNAPTVFGDDTQKSLDLEKDIPNVGTITTAIKLLPGYNLSVVPSFAPEVAIGTLFGTQAIIRYVPKVKVSDMGDFEYFGWGLRHNFDQYIPVPLFPLNIAASFYTQSIKLGDIVDSRTLNFGVQTSLNILPIVTPYIGYQLEKTSMEFSYTYKYVDYNGMEMSVPVSFTNETDFSGRFLAGLSFRFLLLNINFDYSFSKYNAFSFGAGLKF